MRRYFPLLGLALVFLSCNEKRGEITVPPSQPQPAPEVKVPEFNADSAFGYIKTQVGFGPRVPGSTAHKQCGDFIVKTLRRFADTVMEQQAPATTIDGKKLTLRNIIASFNPASKERVLLCAHWDTRPFADEDSIDKTKPFPGANDGGSGVAVILEMARHLKQQKPSIGIDIVMFDLEDWGKPEQPKAYCLGSQHWAEHPHAEKYTARFGVLLDMVGAKDARFALEDNSKRYGEQTLYKIWRAAQQNGYGKHFVFFNRPGILDDHYFINEILRVPTIDIIQYDPNTRSGFGQEWHTHRDNLDAIDPATLKAVGQTLLFVVYHE